MKEIVYIQAGRISNYIGTHFWNTQEAYLSDAGSKETFDVDPDVSMMDSSHDEYKSTLCPRLLLFDTKSSFGTLSTSNALGETEDDNNDIPWSGITQQIQRDRLPKSVYQDQMEQEVNKLPSDQPSQGVGNVRYWSDFSRVYYLPRSLQKLPDKTELDTGGAEWSLGHELFNRYNEDTELMDGALRTLVESCDNLQGLQISSDSDTFGSFMSSFFVSFRDEYVKIPTCTFAMLPGAILSTTSIREDDSRKVINEALYLRSLNEYSTMNIPIQSSQEWPQSAFRNLVEPDPVDLHQLSAILSSHIESVTLPFRLRRGNRDITDLSALLNWRGTGPFSELSGAFSFPSLAAARGSITDFSCLSSKPKDQYSRMDVLRGASEADVLAYYEWANQFSQTRSSLINGPLYPLPTSFPEMIQDSPTRPGFTRTYSALSTSSTLAESFKNYATVVERSVKNGNAVKVVDMHSDDLRELVNELWSIHDNMAEGERE